MYYYSNGYAIKVYSKCFRLLLTAQIIAYITARTATERLFRDLQDCLNSLERVLEEPRLTFELQSLAWQV